MAVLQSFRCQRFARLVCVLSLVSAALPARAQTGTVVFEHVSVLSMTGQARLTNQTVVLASGRIQAIGPSGALRIPGGAHRIDGRGSTLLPGLWDSHVHLLTLADSNVSLVERAERNFFPGYVANGVTTVLDLGAPHEPLWTLRTHLLDASLVGPRVFSVGQLLGGRNPYAPGAPWNREVKDSIDAVYAVDSLRAFGVHLVKVHDFLPRAAHIAITTRAHEYGLRVTGHLSPSVSVGDAIAAGQRSIQHVGPELLAMCTDSSKARVAAFYAAWVRGGPATFADGSVALWRDRGRSSCDQVLRETAAKGLAITPTMVHRFVDRAAARAADGVQSRAAREQCLADARYWTDVPVGTIARYRETIQEFVRSVYAAGVRVIAGTDGPHSCLPAGSALLLELEELVAAGLTPHDAIATATVNAAREVGADSLGTIEAGKVADVILVAGDPSIDITALRRVKAVVARGRLYQRPALDALTESARTFAQ